MTHRYWKTIADFVAVVLLIGGLGNHAAAAGAGPKIFRFAHW
jgi:hypothetical protein